MRASGAWAVAIAAMLTGSLPAASAQESELAGDDQDMRLAPRERAATSSPTDDHVAFMDAVSEEDISAATERANLLEEARRVAPVDLLWGVGR